MTLPSRSLLVAACVGATVVSAQIPPQAPRPVSPNAQPPAGIRPRLPAGGAARPAAANAPAAGAERTAIRPEEAIKPGGGVELQFPNTPLSQILLVYEDLTGLKIIRDANAESATVSIETTGELPKEKAIAFIEKSLLLNGYSFVPAGDGMVKLLAFEAKKPQTEGAPLFESAAELPETDQVVSYVALLKYLNGEDAVKAIDQIIPRHSYGVLTPVPNSKALVIVENSNTIRAILALLERLDVKPGATVTERIQLERSDAEDVKKALDEILGLEDKSKDNAGGSPRANIAPVQATAGAVAGQPAPMPAVPPQGQTASAEIPPKIVAIARTNRLLVIATPERLEEIKALVEELDAASEIRNFVSRTLNYLSVESALGIISDAIARTEGEEGGGGAGGGGNAVNSLGQPANSTAGTTSGTGIRTGTGSGLFGNNLNSGFGSSSLSGGSGAFGSSGTGGGFAGGGGMGTGGANLQPLRQNNGPRSLVIGKTLLISDPTANSLFASGPPEHLRVLNEILDELDRRPQQILISAVIGEMQLGKEDSFGIETLFRARNDANGDTASRGLAGQLGQSVAPLDPRTAIKLTDLASRAGLTFYGGVREGIDVVVNALNTSSDFKVISRPSVFTMNNVPANISSGSSFPIATSTQGYVGNTSGTGLLSNVQYQDVVLSLNIVPLINSDDELTLQISQENSEVAGSTVIAENTYPVLTKQQLNTVIMCKNNSTVLLGGLIRENKEKERSNIPLLGSIPLIKHLTGSTRDENSRRELLIFIQPRIIQGVNDLPPSVRDAPGSSPFGGEATAMMNQEKLPVVAAPAPVKRSRVRELVRKLFGRPVPADQVTVK